MGGTVRADYAQDVDILIAKNCTPSNKYRVCVSAIFMSTICLLTGGVCVEKQRLRLTPHRRDVEGKRAPRQRVCKQDEERFQDENLRRLRE